MAVAQRRPEAVIHHSDQGCQYTSLAFGARCRESGLALSMGSVGDCFDNAMAESFFATLECELLARTSLSTHAEARAAVFDFVEGWYNTRRRRTGIRVHVRRNSHGTLDVISDTPPACRPVSVDRLKPAPASRHAVLATPGKPRSASRTSRCHGVDGSGAADGVPDRSRQGADAATISKLVRDLGIAAVPYGFRSRAETGGRADRPSARGRRGGAGARRGQPDRGGLRAVGPVRTSPPPDERLGGLSRRRARTARPAAPVTLAVTG